MHAVHEHVLAFISDPDRASFEALALEVFGHQFELCEPYRAFCLSRGRRPGSVSDWREIPAVPIQAFKHVSFGCASAERTFLSTGTTAGPELRSRHLMADLRLYRSAARAGLARFLFPDASRFRIASLIASPAERPQSSLAQMVAWAIEDFGTADSDCVVHNGEVDVERLFELLRRSEGDGVPLALLTTTGALIRLLDLLSMRRVAFRLPHGSRLMDTGGDKGAPRPMSRNGILHACWNALAIPGYFIVNEYGMTELSSQYYDNVIAERHAGRHRPRALAAPPWLRTLVVDPTTLRPVPSGELGLLCHFDLANAASVMAILSEDLGIQTDNGLQLRGRAAAAEIRGCSLAAEEWPDIARAAQA